MSSRRRHEGHEGERREVFFDWVDGINKISEIDGRGNGLFCCGEYREYGEEEYFFDRIYKIEKIDKI